MNKSFLTTMGVAVLATMTVGFVNVGPRVIYGEDNRVDIYEVSRADYRELADSTVALIPKRNIAIEANGEIKIRGGKFGTERRLCSDEPFFDQVVAANCSGSLVGEDLIATAGHCVSNSDCSSYNFVFGFTMQNSNTLRTLSSDDVYSCKEIVAREYTRNQDYALVRLDRAVKNRRPLKMQKTPAQPGEEIFVIGHPSGLPSKFADGAAVRTQVGAYFQANLDTYGGNSGSAVFNSRTKEIVGILVRGSNDFSYDRERQCTASAVCPDNGCRGEDVSNISDIINAVNKL